MGNSPFLSRRRTAPERSLPRGRRRSTGPYTRRAVRRVTRAVRALLSLSLLFASPLALRAANDSPISTDRPDQTDSTDTVPKRGFQLETGWQQTRDEGAGARLESDAAFGTLLRYGLGERLELRLGWIGQIEESASGGSGSSRTRGAGDGSLGMKWRLVDADGARPAVALEARASLPVGDRELSTRRADPALLLLVQHELSDRLSLGWNAGVAWSSEEDDAGERPTLSRLLASACLGVAFSERWSGFLELYGDGAGSAPGGATLSADGGLLFLVDPRLQLDLYFGQGLDGTAPARFYGLGVSFLFPD